MIWLYVALGLMAAIVIFFVGHFVGFCCGTEIRERKQKERLAA